MDRSKGVKGNTYDVGAKWPTHFYPGFESERYQKRHREEGWELRGKPGKEVWVDVGEGK